MNWLHAIQFFHKGVMKGLWYLNPLQFQQKKRIALPRGERRPRPPRPPLPPPRPPLMPRSDLPTPEDIEEPNLLPGERAPRWLAVPPSGDTFSVGITALPSPPWSVPSRLKGTHFCRPPAGRRHKNMELNELARRAWQSDAYTIPVFCHWYSIAHRKYPKQDYKLYHWNLVHMFRVWQIF